MKMHISDGTCILCTALFFLVLLSKLVQHKLIMFTKRYGRRHAILGLTYLVWLLIGFYGATVYSSTNSYRLIYRDPIVTMNQRYSWMAYDITLGILGVLLTISAANEFKHDHVKNSASGTLDEHATVTNKEMLEHSFYQGLNLVQVLFLHATAGDTSALYRWAAVLLATSPWLVRSRFPIHHFSDNYNKLDERSSGLVRLLYRVKKYQYVFYKHFLLHGLNISVALSGHDLPTETAFRMYWLLLNTAYVMEFFLQTLVKRRYMGQSTMLFLQKVLMLASTLAAFRVLQHINFILSLCSLVMNFMYRNQDVLNTMTILLLWIAIRSYDGDAV